MSYVESVTGDLISKSLDIVLHNHRVIANNIANADVKGFAPQRLDFATALGDLRHLVVTDAPDDVLARAINASASEPVPTLDATATKIAIDDEMVELTKNTLRYQALLRAKGELGEIAKMAISGGRS